MLNYCFASDNTIAAHPAVLEAVNASNRDAVPGYGDDQYTDRAVALCQQHFGPRAIPYFVTNGTAANVLCLQTLLRSHEAVLCTDNAHIHVHECGALENFTGCKLLLFPHQQGKLDFHAIAQFCQQARDEHEVQPRVISITQCTEFGTVYSLQEIRSIVELAHRHQLYVHIDGARLANAAAHLDCSLQAMTADLGVDVVTFGGTKNGLMLGEAVIFFDPTLAAPFKYIRKQGMQLTSKMRFISAQFIALLENNLWLKNAQNANTMAKKLAAHCQKNPAIEIINPIQSNIIFAKIPLSMRETLQKQFFFYTMDEQIGLVRWVTSYATTPEQVEAFAEKCNNQI